MYNFIFLLVPKSTELSDVEEQKKNKKRKQSKVLKKLFKRQQRKLSKHDTKRAVLQNPMGLHAFWRDTYNGCSAIFACSYFYLLFFIFKMFLTIPVCYASSHANSLGCDTLYGKFFLFL